MERNALIAGIDVQIGDKLNLAHGPYTVQFIRPGSNGGLWLVFAELPTPSNYPGHFHINVSELDLIEREARDFRFEIEAVPEPEMGCTHLVTMIELVVMPPDETWPCETVVDGQILERFTTDDPYGAVEAAREVQVFTFEERMERQFAREMDERYGRC